MWEIREKESRYGHRMGRKDEIEEAYECGFEDGYERALEEAKFGSRRGMRGSY